MNITGWIITIYLAIASYHRIANSAKSNCDCSYDNLDLYDPSRHSCYDGKRYDNTDVVRKAPLGACTNRFVDEVWAFGKCWTGDKCLDYWLMLLIGVLPVFMPFVVDNETRLLAHSVLNTMSFDDGNFKVDGKGNIFAAILIIICVWVLKWDVNNGDGFAGPIRRARKRDQSGRFN